MVPPLRSIIVSFRDKSLRSNFFGGKEKFPRLFTLSMSRKSTKKLTLIDLIDFNEFDKF